MRASQPARWGGVACTGPLSEPLGAQAGGSKKGPQAPPFPVSLLPAPPGQPPHLLPPELSDCPGISVWNTLPVWVWDVWLQL